MNDQSTAIPDKIISYADDTTVLKAFNDTDINMASTLHNLSEWFNANGLSLNLSKTQGFVFSPYNN